MQRKNYQTGSSSVVQRSAPYLEQAGETFLKDIVTPLTGQRVKTETFAPSVAAYDPFTQQAQQMAASQAGLGAISFDPTTGAPTTIGAGTGVAGYQPYLDQAGTYGTQAGTTLGGVGADITSARGAMGTAGTTLATGLGTLGTAGTELGAAGTTLGGVPSYLTGAAGYTGPSAYSQFMSPYQTDVIGATLSEFDKQAAMRQQGISDKAVQLGGYGGGREGVQLAEYQTQSDRDRALLQAQLLSQGYTQAQALANQAYGQQLGLGAAQQGLGTAQAGIAQQRGSLGQLQGGLGGMQGQLGAQYLGAAGQQQGLGTAQQGLGGYYAGLAGLQPTLAGGNIQGLGAAGTQALAYQQAVKDAQAQAAQTYAYEPYQRAGFLGSSITGLLAGQQAPYQPQGPTPAASPLSQALSTGLAAYGIGSMFGR